MALELVRKFVDGKWQYVAEEEDAGGGGLPAEWTVSGDGRLTIAPSASTTLLRLQQYADDGSDALAVAFALGSPRGDFFYAADLFTGEDGLLPGVYAGQFQLYAVDDSDGDAVGGIFMSPASGMRIYTSDDRVSDIFGVGVYSQLNTGNYDWWVSKNGFEATRHQASEPADNEIAAGQCFSWFDGTNGAPKFWRKGKTLNGTVVRASTVMA